MDDHEQFIRDLLGQEEEEAPLLKAPEPERKQRLTPAEIEFLARKAEYEQEYNQLEKGNDGRARLPGLSNVMRDWGRR